MRFSDMLTTSEGFELTRALIDALMSAYKDGKGDQVLRASSYLISAAATLGDDDGDKPSKCSAPCP
jgi:hypothetical protein